MKTEYMISNDWSKKFTSLRKAKKALAEIEKRDKADWGLEYKTLKSLYLLKVTKVVS